MKNFLVLKYNNCEGEVCQMVFNLTKEELINKFVFKWQTNNDVYLSFNVVISLIDSEGEIISEVSNQTINSKSFEVLKSFLSGGNYRLSVRTKCGQVFSGFQSIDFNITKIGVGLEQNLIG